MESQPISASANDVESGAAPTQRLVIRINLGPETPPQQRVERRASRGALLLIVGAAGVLLSWITISLFRTEPASAPKPVIPVSSESTPKPPRETAATRSVEIAPSAVDTNRAEREARQQLDAPPAVINKVLPDVPHSARNTIRGTIKVSVRVIVGKDGAVLSANADDPGPSRYFERLALKAAKKWTFTPATSAEQRPMRVQFNFRRDGTTADAKP